jgi:hypothetical protein
MIDYPFPKAIRPNIFELFTPYRTQPAGRSFRDAELCCVGLGEFRLKCWMSETLWNFSWRSRTRSFAICRKIVGSIPLSIRSP